MTSADRAWAAEEALLREEIRHDPTALGALLAEDFHEIGQSGKHWERQQMVDEMVSEPTEHRTIAIDERRADPLGEHFVLLTYRLDFGGRRSRRSSVWRLDGDEPVVVFHQGTSIG
ncbi:hypothetical protein BH09ACT1_BH09ACT1_14050 [soil metagenome]